MIWKINKNKDLEINHDDSLTAICVHWYEVKKRLSACIKALCATDVKNMYSIK